MKRGVVDVLRRGLDNAVANWPLVLIRLAEAVVFIGIAIAAAVAIIIPTAVSFGLSEAQLETPEGLYEIGSILLQRWLLVLYIVGVVLVLLLVFSMLHSFVEAGSARVYVDAERVAGPELAGPRSRFRVFSMERWMSGGKEGWWPVFWIYNIAWGTAAMIMLIPLVPTIIVMILFAEQNPPIALVGGCLGLIATVLLMLAVGIVVAVWTNRAIVSWAARRGGARDTLAASWRDMRGDLLRHVGVALLILVVSFAASTFLSSFGFFAGMAEVFAEEQPWLLVMTIPLRVFGGLLNTLASSAVAAWFLASFSALAAERMPSSRA